MRVAAVLILLAALAVPAVAHPSMTIPYSLTFHSDGTITGTFGGVPVSGTYSGGTFTLTVDGKTFANGSYSCTSSGCTYTVTNVLGSTKNATFTSPTLVGSTSGSLSGLFKSHGSWVSSVTHWANINLTGVRRGQVVSAAAKIQGKGQNASATTTSEHGKGRGASHRH